MFYKESCSQKFCNIHRNTPVSESLINKVVGLHFIKKETPTQVFFCEYCEIFKNTYFEKHLRTTASVNSRAAVFQESLALCPAKCPNFWNFQLGQVSLANTYSKWKLRILSSIFSKEVFQISG